MTAPPPGRFSRVLHRAGDYRLPLVLGLTDGLLNALTLAASSLVGSGPPAGLSLALRVATAALVTAAFTMFVADYADRRARLVRASRQLNLTRRGHLATTRLGRRALLRSLIATVLACATSFAGAFLPLATGAYLPGPRWLVAALAIAALTALGAALAHPLAGSALRWATTTGVGGVLVTLIGVRLRIT
jgi:hypothetical protein